MGNCHTNNEKIPVDGRFIVDRVLAGEFTDILKTDKYEEIESKNFYVDPAANLKGLATDFVVKEFFKTDSSLFNFMEIIYTTYSEIINYYRTVRLVNVSGDSRPLNEDEIFFIHKGGNVLRIVSTEFLLELPASVSRELSTFYSPFFKRSDADFSIYISPYIEDYDKVYEEVGLISFLTLDYLRNIFIENPENYFDYFKYNMLVKKEILHKHLMRFNHIEGYKFESLSVGTGGKGVNNDVMVIPSSEKMIRRITLDKYNPVFINSYNSALDIVRNNRRAKFTLARTKVSLALKIPRSEYLTDKPGYIIVGGELIDVTIQHKDDVATTHFFKNLSKYVTEYRLAGLVGRDVLIFKSYSVYYLIKDLEEIIFKENKFPWDEKKYIKRINRLVYLYFVNLFETMQNGTQRNMALKDFKDQILLPLSIRDEKFSNKKYIRKYKNILLKNLAKYLGALYRNSKHEEDKDRFSKFVALLLNNFEHLLSVINKTHNYCLVDGDIDYRDIYVTSSKTLI